MKGGIEMNEKSQEDPINISIIENIFRTENITHLLQTLKITTSAGSNINIIKEIANNPVNKSILIRIPTYGCIGENKILLDIKDGLPMVDQVYRALYGSGSNCSKRIIGFTDGHCWDDKENPGADIEKVKSLVETMNEYDQGIYLVKINSDSTASDIDFEVLAQPNDQPKFSKADCPTKEHFTESELWQIHFWPTDFIFQEFAFQSEFDPNREYGLFFEVGGLGIDTKWNHGGALILVTDTNAKGNKLESIWDAKKKVIFDMFRGCDIEVLYSSGRMTKLTITVFNKPIGDLAGVPWREKMHYAGLLFSKYMRLEGFIERALQDLKTKK
jgi:hypothetical protein